MQLSTGYNRRPRATRVPREFAPIVLGATQELDRLEEADIQPMSLVNAREGTYDFGGKIQFDRLFDLGFERIDQIIECYDLVVDVTGQGGMQPMRYNVLQEVRQTLRTLGYQFLQAVNVYEACRQAYKKASECDRRLLFMDGKAASSHIQWCGWLFCGAVEAATKYFGAEILPKPTDAADRVKHTAYDKGVLALENILTKRRGHSYERTFQLDQRPREPVDGYDEDAGQAEGGAPLVADFKVGNRKVRVFHSLGELRGLKARAEDIRIETGERPALDELVAEEIEDFTDQLFGEDADKAADIMTIYAEDVGLTPAAPALGYLENGKPDGWQVARPAHSSAIVEG